MAALDVRAMRQRANGVFAGFTNGQKAMMAIAVVAVLIGMVMFTRSGNGPQMAALYSNLATKDASAITQELDGMGVTYELAANGATIMVPKSDVYQTRLDLSAKGMPSGGQDDYTLLDNQGITTSQFSQRVDFQRALAGELAEDDRVVRLGRHRGREPRDPHRRRLRPR